MKVGAEPKRLAILGVLVILAAYFVYTGVFSGTPTRSATTAPARTQAVPGIEQVAEPGRPVPRPDLRSQQEFKPSLRPVRADQKLDLTAIDPTLRLDLLAKLDEVQLQGGNRSLFEFSAPPAPPEPKVVPAAKIQTVPLPPPPPPPPEPERKPAPPPIPLKYFGYQTAFRQGNRRGFFLDGDQVLLASEGDVLKKRYRVVRLGVNSVVMEDLEFKAEQTLPLEPQVG